MRARWAIPVFLLTVFGQPIVRAQPAPDPAESPAADPAAPAEPEPTLAKPPELTRLVPESWLMLRLSV